MFENPLGGIAIQHRDAHVASSGVFCLELGDSENMLVDVDQDARRDSLQVAKSHYFHATVDRYDTINPACYRFGQSFDLGEFLK